MIKTENFTSVPSQIEAADGSSTRSDIFELGTRDKAVHVVCRDLAHLDIAIDRFDEPFSDLLHRDGPRADTSTDDYSLDAHCEEQVSAEVSNIVPY